MHFPKFYVVLILGVVQNITRSFLNEKRGTLLYYRFLVNSKAIIIAKILYQFLINLIFLFILFIVMNFWLPQEIPQLVPYGVTAFLFTMSCSIVFTFNSALSLGARNSSLVALILSMPLLLPSLLISLKSSSKALTHISSFNFYPDWGVLILLLIIQLILSISLFSYIWRE